VYLLTRVHQARLHGHAELCDTRDLPASGRSTPNRHGGDWVPVPPVDAAVWDLPFRSAGSAPCVGRFFPADVNQVHFTLLNFMKYN